MRVAIIGASHWHVDQFYIPALRQHDVEIVAVHDPDGELADRVAAELECPSYTDHKELVEQAEPDLVFAHARHAEMTQLAADLIDMQQPFHMEKPMGIDWPRLDALAAKAETEGVWTSVALVSRYYGAVEALHSLRESGELGKPCEYYYRLFAGPPSRYEQWGASWMLDPKFAGAGPLWNFGPHVIDLFFYLIEDDVAAVRCWTLHDLYELEIEDQATIRLTSSSGVVGVGQMSYTLPEGYETFFSLTTDRLHCGTNDMARGTIQLRDGSEQDYEGPGLSDVYHTYVADTLQRFAAGQVAKATIDDMVTTLRVMDAALESARRDREVRLPGA